MNKTKFFNSRGFGIICIAFALLGTALMLHQFFAFENMMRPRILADPVGFKVYQENFISGFNHLAYFTVQSNLLVYVFLLLGGIALISRSDLLLKLYHNDILRGAITLYILFTGILYDGLLLWFQKFYDWSTPYAIYNIINIWYHMITPALFFTFWFVPLNNKKIEKKMAFIYLSFPLLYYIGAIVRGVAGSIHFYPYPFLNPVLAWDYLGGGKAYNAPLAYLVVIAFFVAFVVSFYWLGRMLIRIHNKKVERYAAIYDLELEQAA